MPYNSHFSLVVISFHPLLAEPFLVPLDHSRDFDASLADGSAPVLPEELVLPGKWWRIADRWWWRFSWILEFSFRDRLCSPDVLLIVKPVVWASVSSAPKRLILIFQGVPHSRPVSNSQWFLCACVELDPVCLMICSRDCLLLLSKMACFARRAISTHNCWSNDSHRI